MVPPGVQPVFFCCQRLDSVPLTRGIVKEGPGREYQRLLWASVPRPVTPSQPLHPEDSDQAELFWVLIEKKLGNIYFEQN